MAKCIIITVFFSISFDNDFYHDVNLPLMGKEMLSTYLLDIEN